MLDGMNSKRWIRLIAIVGAYFLIRPYILKFGAKIQAEEHAKSIHSEEAKAQKAKISANSIRGQVEIPNSEDEEDEVEATGNEPQWGKKARKRSRKVVRDILEEQERRLEEDDNEDIKEFLESDVLVDYNEGEDGW